MLSCQTIFAPSDSDIGMVCGKPAATSCADCGAVICADCRTECCGESFCEPCYDYHFSTPCVRKPVQSEYVQTRRDNSGIGN
jgi:hypothetical protein